MQLINYARGSLSSARFSTIKRIPATIVATKITFSKPRRVYDTLPEASLPPKALPMFELERWRRISAMISTERIMSAICSICNLDSMYINYT